MNRRKKLKPGDEVTFNTNKYNDKGFWQGTIYIVNEIVGNTSVTLKGYDNNIIGKMHLELA
jgi:hypothetical protein